MVGCSAPWQGSDTASCAVVTLVPLVVLLVFGSAASRPSVATCVGIFVSRVGFIVGVR